MKMNKFIRVILFAVGFYFIPTTLVLAQSERSKLVVTINGIPTQEGQMIVALHDTEENFPKSPILKYFGMIENGISIVEFTNVEYGNYAVTVIHDLNKNGKMDFNWFHIPSENAAASKNAKGFMGPPKFNDAKFSIHKREIYIDIELTDVHSKLSK